MTDTPAPHDEREELLSLLGTLDHAPMSAHSGHDGSCVSCPWPLHERGAEDIADAILAAGYRKPTVQPTARPTTEGGVWGSYVAYLEALESRVQPTVEDVARALHLDPETTCGLMWLDCQQRGDKCFHVARITRALFTTAPTVADVREQVAREIEGLVDDMGDPDPGWRAGVMSAANLARGGDTQ